MDHTELSKVSHTSERTLGEFTVHEQGWAMFPEEFKGHQTGEE